MFYFFFINKFSSRTLTSSNQSKLYEQSEIGPLKWMAPESIQKSQYSTKSDVYSFGMTVIEVLTREKPFRRFNNNQYLDELAADRIHPVKELSSEIYSDQVKELVRACTEKNPDQRLDFVQIMKVLNVENFAL